MTGSFGAHDAECYLPYSQDDDNENPVVVKPFNIASSTIDVWIITGIGPEGECSIWRHHDTAARYVKDRYSSILGVNITKMTKKEFLARASATGATLPHAIHVLTVHRRENANDTCDGSDVMAALKGLADQGVHVFPALENVLFAEIKSRYMKRFQSLCLGEPPGSDTFLEFTVIKRGDVTSVTQLRKLIDQLMGETQTGVVAKGSPSSEGQHVFTFRPNSAGEMNYTELYEVLEQLLAEDRIVEVILQRYCANLVSKYKLTDAVLGRRRHGQSVRGGEMQGEASIYYRLVVDRDGKPDMAFYHFLVRSPRDPATAVCKTMCFKHIYQDGVVEHAKGAPRHQIDRIERFAQNIMSTFIALTGLLPWIRID